MNQYAFTVPDNVENTDLLRVMRGAWPTAPVRVFRLALRRRDVKVNGSRVQENIALKGGDTITWYTTWQQETPTILYEDDDVLVVAKPAGLSTDVQGSGEASLIGWAQEYVGTRHTVRLVHRLDQLTCGLVILALSDVAEAALLRLFREQQVVKEYTCLVGGQPPEAASLKDYLLKDAGAAKVTLHKQQVPGSKTVLTDFMTISREGEVSRLLVTLRTGRTHQIRAHLAFYGWPILGDDKYGDRALNKRQGGSQLRLAATMLQFPACKEVAGISGKTWRLRAPF